jgi:hypothetical protein
MLAMNPEDEIQMRKDDKWSLLGGLIGIVVFIVGTCAQIGQIHIFPPGLVAQLTIIVGIVLLLLLPRGLWACFFRGIDVYEAIP